eukprot:9230114-Pyramimonas_sp.AAC.1
MGRGYRGEEWGGGIRTRRRRARRRRARSLRSSAATPAAASTWAAIGHIRWHGIPRATECVQSRVCLLYTSPSPRDRSLS